MGTARMGVPGNGYGKEHMEIERNVPIDESRNSEAGISSGPRNMDQLPAYTDAEIEKELGPVSWKIERLFRGSLDSPPQRA
jgi:hypothetical protein